MFSFLCLLYFCEFVVLFSDASLYPKREPALNGLGALLGRLRLFDADQKVIRAPKRTNRDELAMPVI
jgi:hypothetical protein